VLLSLIDHAGEVVDKLNKAHPRRRRALRANGILLMFDMSPYGIEKLIRELRDRGPLRHHLDNLPGEQPLGSGGTRPLTLEEFQTRLRGIRIRQKSELRNLFQDARKCCGLSSAKEEGPAYAAADEVRVRDVPIAFCLTRMDLLPRPGAFPEERSGEVSVNWGHPWDSILPAIQAAESDYPALDIIEKRSELCKELLQSVEECTVPLTTLQMSFANYKFFPTSAAGFENPPSMFYDKQKRVPFGIPEPILWLLHMNGFNVFRRSWAAGMEAGRNRACGGSA
jgi:hypothetical protein